MIHSSASENKDAKVPTEFAGDHVIWATWLYFAEQKTQNEVARELNVSRTTIVNYLSEARKRGLVSIKIADDILGNVELGRLLAKKYGLAHAHVVPTPEGKINLEQLLRERLGIAAAHVLSSILTPKSILGVSSGRTVLALGQALNHQEFKNVKVVQAAGHSISGENYSPEYCTALIANKLQAQSINLYAPAVISSTRLCEEILNEPSLVRQFELFKTLDILIFGVSGFEKNTTFSDTYFMTKDVIEHYLEQKSIGVVLGRLVDEHGNETEGPLSGRIVGMDLSSIPNIPQRIMVAGGENKVKIIQTMLNQAMVTHLVTDMKTAQKLV